jgi:uncharacterized protein
VAGNPINPSSCVADTSFLYAVIDRRSKQHTQAVEFYDKYPGLIIVPLVVVPELTYLLHELGGAMLVVNTVRGLYESQVTLLELSTEDYQRGAAILEKYSDTRIDFVDACVMAVAEHLKVTRVLTFDHRDFGIFQPQHIKRFELIPLVAPPQPTIRGDSRRFPSPV